MLVETYSWSNISLTLQNGKTILDDIYGSVSAGEMLAIMGPSGCGKSTLLNVLAYRTSPRSSTLEGGIFINNERATLNKIKQLSSYVEQEDSLIGSLTVLETVDYSAQFAGIDKAHKKELVSKTIKSLGLEGQAMLKIGTPIQKGISGGQKRRVSIASQIITSPSILFLDEPTSGLDSVASREVISTIKKIAKRENMIIICSIHQPSTYTFELFDKVMFLSKGRTVYNGAVSNVVKYFNSIGHTMPPYINPAEYVLDLINTDFQGDSSVLDDLVSKWNSGDVHKVGTESVQLTETTTINEMKNILILIARSLTKARRDILTYYVRLVMYLGLAILMGTVWLRLQNGQKNIQPFINAIFFSGAFMSFMSVAYIPSYLEDIQSYKKERMNGLYGPLAFSLANFLVGLPFLFLIAAVFSVITFFMVNFHQTASGFWYYLMWLFLDLVAAESMTTFIASVFPNFVVSLAITAFANGLWMAVGGFLVPSNILNVFWYYTFYWIDYQRYVFQGMIFNEFTNREFRCGDGCHCMYDSPLASQCKISGKAVLESLGYGNYDKGLWIGVLIALVFVYRFATYIVLKLRK